MLPVFNSLANARLFTKEELDASPSRLAGFTKEQETKLRKMYTRFIKDMIRELKLSAFTFEAATVYCHRFFAVRSMQQNDRFLVACACILLAGKSDDSPRSVKDVANAYLRLKAKNKAANAAATMFKSEEVESTSRAVLKAEYAVLLSINFCLQTDFPVSKLLKAWKKHGTGDAVVAQTAVGFLNDSLDTTLRLQYPACHIGLAALHQAAQVHKVQLPEIEGQPFLEFFGVPESAVHDIVQQLMEPYVLKTQQQGGAAPAGQATLASAQPDSAAQTTLAAPAALLNQAKPVAQSSEAAAAGPAGSKPQAAEEQEEGELPDEGAQAGSKRSADASIGGQSPAKRSATEAAVAAAAAQDAARSPCRTDGPLANSSNHNAASQPTAAAGDRATGPSQPTSPRKRTAAACEAAAAAEEQQQAAAAVEHGNGNGVACASQLPPSSPSKPLAGDADPCLSGGSEPPVKRRALAAVLSSTPSGAPSCARGSAGGPTAPLEDSANEEVVKAAADSPNGVEVQQPEQPLEVGGLGLRKSSGEGVMPSGVSMDVLESGELLDSQPSAGRQAQQQNALRVEAPSACAGGH